MQHIKLNTKKNSKNPNNKTQQTYTYSLYLF